MDTVDNGAFKVKLDVKVRREKYLKLIVLALGQDLVQKQFT